MGGVQSHLFGKPMLMA